MSPTDEDIKAFLANIGKEADGMTAHEVRKRVEFYPVLFQRVVQLESLARELVEAVKALPVEEMVHQNPDGSPELLGYVMQVQGEWDSVISALSKAREVLGDE